MNARRHGLLGRSEPVFCHLETGRPFDRKRYADTLRLALARAKLDGRVRPSHVRFKAEVELAERRLFGTSSAGRDRNDPHDA